jgi:predicted nucleic acid-binding protein
MAAAAPPVAPLVVAGEAPLLYLDANVLLPAYLRSVFLDLADAALVRVHWGPQVLEEVRRNLRKPRFGQTPQTIDKLFADMDRAFPDAPVLGSAQLEPRFVGKTDPKDAHVAAGALKLSRSRYSGQTVVLVTSNVKHLPAAAFAGTMVRPATPNTLLRELIATNPVVADVMAAMLRRFLAPPISKEDFLQILDSSNCRGFAAALGDIWGFGREPRESQ